MSFAVYMFVVCMPEFFLYQFFRNDLPWAYIYIKYSKRAMWPAGKYRHRFKLLEL